LVSLALQNGQYMAGFLLGERQTSYPGCLLRLNDPATPAAQG
jgi:hypothetical protein